MTVLGQFLLAATLLAPLLGAAAALRPRRSLPAFLPLLPVPGLLAALLAPEGVRLELPDILLGAALRLEAEGRLFLGAAAFLWIAAGFFARAYMPRPQRLHSLAVFWCLTLTGNLGVFVAGDVAGFYAAFACLSLAAYPLVVHDRTAEALRAGRVYIVLALVGETCLLLGFLIATAGAASLALPDIRLALAAVPARDAAIGLLVVGFGVKAGLVPLHVWLPLAHPAAPTPASAVLSGAIVKAGIFGLIAFLPRETALPAWQDLLTLAGLATAWFGILAGLGQSHPKAILAYSTMSQMGLVVTVIAAGLGAEAAGPALAAAGFYALHHGLAKGALFLGVGVVPAAAGGARRAVLAVLGLTGLAIAGLPLTAGALAKLAIKPPLGGGVVEVLVTLSAVGTGLLMLRFLVMLSRAAPGDGATRPARGVVLPWVAVTLAAFLLPWLLAGPFAALAPAAALLPYNLWTAIWPILVAAALAAAALQMRERVGMPRIPPGDLLALAEAATRRAAALRQGLALRPARWDPGRVVRGGWRATGSAAAALERRLARWSVGGALLLALGLLAAASGW